MSFIDNLYAELDHWHCNGDAALFWWRDDDARAASPALIRLLGLARKYDAPLALAVIPDGLETSLVELLGDNPLAGVLQHGFNHQNHAPATAKKQELGRHRDINAISAQLRAGFEILKQQFGARFIPILTPPWNRIDHDLLPLLRALGFVGLSCYGARQMPAAVDSVWSLNTHVDIINWQQNQQFVGEQAVARMMIGHLQKKRQGLADRTEPTGLLTHHLVHDNASHEFIATLLAALDAHPAATWLSAERALQLPPRDRMRSAAYVLPTG